MHISLSLSPSLSFSLSLSHSLSPSPSLTLSLTHAHLLELSRLQEVVQSQTRELEKANRVLYVIFMYASVSHMPKVQKVLCTTND
jgi:hypothetical protein